MFLCLSIMILSIISLKGKKKPIADSNQIMIIVSRVITDTCKFTDLLCLNRRVFFRNTCAVPENFCVPVRVLMAAQLFRRGTFVIIISPASTVEICRHKKSYWDMKYLFFQSF